VTKQQSLTWLSILDSFPSLQRSSESFVVVPVCSLVLDWQKVEQEMNPELD